MPRDDWRRGAVEVGEVFLIKIVHISKFKKVIFDEKKTNLFGDFLVILKVGPDPPTPLRSIF